MFFKKKKQESKRVYIVLEETLGRKHEGLVPTMFNIHLLPTQVCGVFAAYDEAVKWITDVGSKYILNEGEELESNGFGSWFTKIKFVPGSQTIEMRTRYSIVEEIVTLL